MKALDSDDMVPGTRMSFKDAPVGARFKYPRQLGGDSIWVKIDSYPKGPDSDGNGLVVHWNGNVEGNQSYCSFVSEDEGIDFNTEIELI